MYVDLERLEQLLIALILGGCYYFILIYKLKNITALIFLMILWIAGFILMRDIFSQLVLMFNNGIYPLSFEQYIIIGQDIFLALLIFTVGQLKFSNDES